MHRRTAGEIERNAAKPMEDRDSRESRQGDLEDTRRLVAGHTFWYDVKQRCERVEEPLALVVELIELH